MEHVSHLHHQQKEEDDEGDQTLAYLNQHDVHLGERSPQPKVCEELQEGKDGHDAVDKDPVDGVIVEIVVAWNQVFSVAQTETEVGKVHRDLQDVKPVYCLGVIVLFELGNLH